MLPTPVSGCRWVTDHLLVTTTRRGHALHLPAVLQRRLAARSVQWALHLIGKSQYVEASTRGYFPAPDTQPAPAPDRLLSSFSFYPEEAHTLPTARQVRQALDFIELAHRAGQRVLLDGAGQPWRAALTAGCWLARQERAADGNAGTSPPDREAARLGWMRPGSPEPRVTGTMGPGPDGALTLDAAQRAFVLAWPGGRDGQPDLADLEWSEADEVFPWASVDYWLGELPTVRLYPRGRLGRRVRVPVRAGDRYVVRHGTGDDDLRFTLDDLHAGTWVGERTLRLRDGAVIVFASP